METTGVYTGKYSNLDDSNQDTISTSVDTDDSQNIYKGKYST